MAVIFQIMVNGLLAAALYTLVAVGLSFLYATTKIFHLAHGIVVLWAGYLFWWVWTVLGWHPAVAVLLALAGSALAGLLMNELVYEVLRRRGTRGLGYLIATLALLMFGTATIQALFGAAPRALRFQTPTLVFHGVYLTALQVWMLGLAVGLTALFFWFIKYTKVGTAMRATADNETVAEVLGINTRRIRRLAFAASSVLASAAGVLIGLEFNLDPNMGIFYAVRGFAGAVIGGVGSVAGALLGSGLIGLVEQGVVWFWGNSWRGAVAFVLLFLFLLVRPQGIFGRKNLQ